MKYFDTTVMSYVDNVAKSDTLARLEVFTFAAIAAAAAAPFEIGSTPFPQQLAVSSSSSCLPLFLCQQTGAARTPRPLEWLAVVAV